MEKVVCGPLIYGVYGMDKAGKMVRVGSYTNDDLTANLQFIPQYEDEELDAMFGGEDHYLNQYLILRPSINYSSKGVIKNMPFELLLKNGEVVKDLLEATSIT